MEVLSKTLYDKVQDFDWHLDGNAYENFIKGVVR